MPAAMANLVLYTYWRSSSSYRVRIALGMKGLRYESVPVDLRAGEQGRADHLDRSPSGYVPCLVIDGRSVVESVAIIELLDELVPSPPLLPADAWGRARVRTLVEIVNSGIQPLQNLSILHHLPEGDGRQAWAKHWNERGLGALERAMQAHEQEGVRGPFAYGATLTMADAFIVPQVYSAQRFGVDVTRFPRVHAAAEAALATPAVIQAVPERQPDAPK
jgi:maleylpyruvate isomerase